MGINWQKWVTEDLKLSLDDIASITFSRDIETPDAIEALLRCHRWKTSKVLDTGKVTLNTKSGQVHIAAIDWATETIITS